jgi:putative ABC transport system substrate-binding protein
MISGVSAERRRDIKQSGTPAMILSIVLALTIPVIVAESGSQKRIGILMFGEETRYIEATRGFVDQLKQDGFSEPDVKFIRENAGGNKAKAAELVTQFAAAKFDLIVTLGTSATLAVAREIKDVPIVFPLVYDPVEVGIAKSWNSSGNNTTGTSPNIPMSKILDALKAFAPVKILAVLYSPTEKNSETQLKELLRFQAKYRIKVIPVPITEKEEIAKVMPDVVRTSDAIYVTGSNLIGSQLPFIVDLATKGKVITISHLSDLVEKGVLLGVCSNPYNRGRLAGKMAVRILKGAKPSSIPIEKTKDIDLIINMKTANAGKFLVPSEFMKKVNRKIN